MELQQSLLYKTFIERLKWKTADVDGTTLFIKHIPFMGGLAKLQRTKKLPDPKILIPFLQKARIRTLAAEPAATVSQKTLDAWIDALKPHVRLNTSYYLPTKTIVVDLTAREEAIFHRFSEAKRRAVRRAVKYGLRVEVSQDIDTLIRTKNISAGFMGFMTTFGQKKLWEVFEPNHTAVVLAYDQQTPVGGIFLIFWNDTAYYWIAGATKAGKKKFAPTLLAWEAMRYAKKHKAKRFDFVGVWDERIPTHNKEWLGFTKFKEGFGGEEIYYPIIL